ncbi:hypothetical protein D910_00278 [Dendroctonus ponderosae]|uniref:Reverse transcriptase zinc-binding domain-containing protein n=1 Tax=Dendroctonus ponderosae TaxID=77166 RepID=U4TPL3_DENPD|nr:hypothetical protein D910_00278 [Dendroctonus ponderosae]
MIPIDLLAKERTDIEQKGPAFKNEARAITLQQWQERWDEYPGWTKVFIKSVSAWTDRSLGETDYYVTQALTGHGVFGTYLKRIGKQENDDCWLCGQQANPEHTVFHC